LLWLLKLWRRREKLSKEKKEECCSAFWFFKIIKSGPLKSFIAAWQTSIKELELKEHKKMELIWTHVFKHTLWVLLYFF
jgi:hypothetical protein